MELNWYSLSMTHCYRSELLLIYEDSDRLPANCIGRGVWPESDKLTAIFQKI